MGSVNKDRKGGITQELCAGSKKPGAALGTLLLEVQDLRLDSGPEPGQVQRW